MTACLLASCGNRLEHNSWKWDMTTDPLTIQLTQTATEAGPRLTGGDQSSLFYITGLDTQYVTTQQKLLLQKEGHFKAQFATTDGRTATVSLQRQPEGSLKLQFKVSPDSGIVRKGMTIKAKEGEAYYGLMERVVSGDQSKSWQPGVEQALDIRGQKITMHVEPTIAIYEPFYVSSEGYGVFVEGSWPGQYDMAASNPNQISFSFEGAALNVHFIKGPDQQQVVERLHELIGMPILPPKWAFSVFHWRDEHINRDTLYDGTRNTSPYNAMITEDMLMMEALDIPFGVYWVDRPWAKGSFGYDNFEWNREQFPQPKQMIDWLHRNDKKFMLWIAPWAMGDAMLDEARKQDYLIPGSSDNTFYDDDIANSDIQLIDFTNPEAVEWWGTYLGKVIDDGVDGFKLDRAEERMPNTTRIKLDNGKTAREMHNAYSLLYIKAAYEQVKRNKGDEDFLLMPRAAYTGSQQYGVFWAGDIRSGPWGLRAALIAVQRAAYMGFPLWGSDTGGYWGDGYSHENLARWLAFSCFTPIMEVGPLKNRAVWDMPEEPSYDPKLIATYRLYATLHTKLMDYSYQQAKKAHNEGTPIVRPMAMAFPDDEQATEEWDQFLYGPDILVSIVWQNDVRQKSVYLPEGRWEDAWSGKVYEGPRKITIETPRHKIPIFLRKGSELELGDLNALYNESVKIARDRPDLKKLLRKADFKADTTKEMGNNSTAHD